MTFESFDLEDGDDYIEIEIGSSKQNFSGSSLPGPFTGTNILVTFITDSIGTGLGFFASVCCSAHVQLNTNRGNETGE